MEPSKSGVAPEILHVKTSAKPADEELPPYPGISLSDVVLVRTPPELIEACAALLASPVLGFDTESKPTFRPGEVSTGPHLIQLATAQKVFLFQVGRAPLPEALNEVLQAVLAAPGSLKVGFGLRDDLKRLQLKYDIRAENVLDLAVALRQNSRQDMGAKTAVAHFFGQRLQKSKKTSTTNWSLPTLSDAQILYAANDAQVALRVYLKWRELSGQVVSI